MRVLPELDRQLRAFDQTPTRRLFISQWNLQLEASAVPMPSGRHQARFRLGDGLGTDGDLGRVLRYDVLRSLGMPPIDGMEVLTSLIANGLWSTLLLDEGAILCRRPRAVRVDEFRQLHDVNRPAHAWEDGVEEYRLHGVSVPPEIFRRDLDVEEILSDANLERRRVLLDFIGRDRLLAHPSVQVVNSDVDASGQPRRLLRFSFETVDDLGLFWVTEEWTFVEVRCPSTGHVHYLRVPPQTSTCARAVAWTFGLTPRTYAPLLEA